MTALYRFLADLVVVVHLAFVAFVVLGGVLVLRWPRLAWTHLPAAAWGAFVEFSGWVCPLTPLEWWLRAQGGACASEGGFIERYVLSTLYPEWLTRPTQFVLGAIVVVVNVTLYVVVWRRRALATARAGRTPPSR